ncbi:MAG: GNAT family N-acetyltransferase [Clostridia bacterium]|nr:GNAT family N-acetyltransferase [Clostridia bacterium]
MIQVKKSEVENIKNWLKSEGYLTLNIQGMIENTDYPIFTDDVNAPNGIYIKEGYFYYIYGKTSSFVEAFHETLEDSFIGFSGTNEVVLRFYENYCMQWENSCRQYHYPKKTVDELKVLESLKIEDAAFVQEHYEYASDESYTSIQSAILNRPTSCLRNEEGLMSFVMLHDDNSIGYMYTLEKYRGQGHAYALTQSIVAKALETGRLPYIQIVYGNEPSMGLAKKSGFEYHGDVYWFGIVHTKGEDFENGVLEYRQHYKCLPQSIATRLSLKKDYEKKGVVLMDGSFVYDEISYPFQCVERDGLYCMFIENTPDWLIKEGLIELMKEDDHVVMLNQKITLKGFQIVNSLE